MASVGVTQLVGPTAAHLREAAQLFDQYRLHYGESALPGQTVAWLTDQTAQRRLMLFTATLDDELVGVTTTVVIPASLRLSHFWQIRDLYVAPEARRNGVARAMLDAVRRAATEAGAVRVSVQTEKNNGPALRLYRASGFTVVGDLESLVQPLRHDV